MNFKGVQSHPRLTETRSRAKLFGARIMPKHSAPCSGIAKDEGASDTLVVINDLKEALALLAVKVDLTNIKVFIHQEL